MSKGVCWRRGYRVLGVVLMWLVVPAEAASGGVSALAGAALAATAAGVGAAVNYWAAMEDETAGDIKVLSKGKGIMRLMSTNLRRVKREQGDGDEMSERVWIDTLQAVEDAGVDVWAAQDTGVEDGGSPGQAALWSAGKLQQKVGSGWGGRKMGWTHQQGHKVGKGLRRGGTFLAVKEDWRAEMHKVRTDRRGWGRYVIRELKGRNGASMAVVSLYLPTGADKKEPGGGAWDWQAQQMRNLRGRLERQKEAGTLDKQDSVVLEHLEQLDTLVVGGKGGAANPVSLALLDLAHDLNKVRSEYEVVVGDWNVRNPRGKASTSAARRRNTAMVSRFAAQRGLVDPLKSRMDWGEEEPVTYTSGERRSWIDYFLVSKKLEDRGLVRAAGVLAEPINESDHRPVMLDIDADTALGRSRLWDDIKEAQEESDKSNRNAKFKAVQLGKVGRIKCYQEAVEKKWPEEGQLSNEITEFCSMVNEMGSRVWEDKAVEEEVVTQGNRLMTEALGAMLSGQETVYNKLPVVGRRGAGGQRKHQSSPVYVKLAQEMRMAVRLAKLIREGTRVNWLIARLAKIKGLGIHMDCLN